MKAKAAGQDPHLALLAHRNTPSQGLDSSPVQQLLNRVPKMLPMEVRLLKTKVVGVSQNLKNK